GIADDGLPGATASCSLNNDDSWLTQARAAGRVAHDIAEIASDSSVIIVQAAGNESDKYCDPLSADPPCTLVQIDAQNTSEFIWAERHWACSCADPIVGVEALDQGLAGAT